MRGLPRPGEPEYHGVARGRQLGAAPKPTREAHTMNPPSRILEHEEPWKFCPGCAAEIVPEARFCNVCGRPVSPAVAGTGGGSDSPRHRDGEGARRPPFGWWVAGLLGVALLLVLVYPRGESSDPSTPARPAGGGVPGVDLSSMTPREAADRLFNRVMEAVSTGDSTEVLTFLPMSIAAYDRARPLNLDGLFHLSLLQAVGFDFRSAQATAMEGLGEEPAHLLLLSAAGGAALATGDSAAASDFYTRLLDGYDAEVARGLPEYEEHAALLPVIRREALEFLRRESAGPP